MVLVFCDIETTGLEWKDGHRIIEIAVLFAKLEEKKLSRIKTVTKRINPNRSISKKSEEVHGISIEALAGCPTWDSVAPSMGTLISKTDWFIAHNVDFDYGFVTHELNRVGFRSERFPKPYCTMQNARWATFDGKLPNLEELCVACGVHYDPKLAHAAEYDIEKTFNCFQVGLDYGLYQLNDLI
jgi:DNA polymerase-3 subunit epsilon